VYECRTFFGVSPLGTLEQKTSCFLVTVELWKHACEVWLTLTMLAWFTLKQRKQKPKHKQRKLSKVQVQGSKCLMLLLLLQFIEVGWTLVIALVFFHKPKQAKQIAKARSCHGKN